ncbi:hypothetical protein [Lachnoclostridium phytofermentans]|uniref:Uncharacterized protein n=1 Tax=Lachnoclostridium phytofermentans (strain ATCC 700394 / DSM 18823 / ISDg) TaxID=357809 RepID=A9KI56_LACP7|nr:hypothetical protein [Lachnoclostridium phytofermentans]ABX40890.1 hypothetical protein Cphy_0503 [Lachnoclostridium phytofermentans ISDg]
MKTSKENNTSGTDNTNSTGNTSKAKRVLSMIGIIILLGLYLFSLVAAIMAKPYANGLFLTSIYATVIIPVFIYVFLLMNRTFGKKNDGYTMHEINKMKKKGFQEANKTDKEDN